MTVSTEIVAFKALDVAAGVPVAVAFPMYEAAEVEVYYGKDALLAVLNTDYTVTLQPEEFDTFEVTPTAALIAKINALIAGDPTETNFITIRSNLDYMTSSTSSAVRYTPFTSREFDRTSRRFAQVQDALNRSLTLAPTFVGDSPKLQLNEVTPNTVLIFNEDGTAIEAGPTVTEIGNAEGYAQAAEDARDAALAAQTAAQTAETNAETAETNAETAQAAAEAAQAATEAAVAAVNIQAVDNRTALKALNTNAKTVAYLKEAKREGLFEWKLGDYSALIAADVNEGIYVKANAIASNVGAWVRSGGWAVGGDAFVAWWTGANDDDTVQTAINAVPSTARLVFEKRLYSISVTISSDRELSMCWAGARFHKTTSGRLFSFVTNFAEEKALSANYVAGALTLAVSAMAQALKPGEAFKIFSNVIDGADRFQVGTSQYRNSEWAVAAEGTTATSIVIAQPLRWVRGVSPSSGLDVDSYTTTDNARVFRLSGRTLKIECDLATEIFYTDGMEATWVGEALKISGYINPVVDDFRITRGYGHGISLGGNYKPVINRPRLFNLEDNTGNSQYGYGIADASYGTIVNDPYGYNCRHVYTSSVALQNANDSNSERVLSAGRTVGAKINNGIAMGSGGTPVAPWDTHQSSEDAVFNNCYVEGSADYGFNIRGRNITLVNPIVKNCEHGINIFTEFNSGDWLTKKDLNYFTSALVLNAQIECRTTPIHVSHATVAGDGRCTAKSTGHNIFFNEGGQIVWDGKNDWRTDDFLGSRPYTTETGFGIIHNTNVSATLTGIIADTAFILAEGSDVFSYHFNAVDGANNIRALHNGSTCSMSLRGRLNVRLSSSFNRLLSPTGTFTSTEDSDFVFALNGAADNTLVTNYGTNKVKFRADDNTCFYDATGDVSMVRKFSSRNVDVNVTHNGTGAFVDNIYNPNMPQIKNMDSAGHSFHMRMMASKGGSTGVATIRIRLATAFVADIALVAGDRQVDIDVLVNVQGNDDQRVYVKASVNDGATTSTVVVRQLQRDNTVDLSAATFGLSFGAQAVVGDTIKFEGYELHSTIAGFGVI